MIAAGGVAVHERKNFSKYSQFFLVRLNDCLREAEISECQCVLTNIDDAVQLGTPLRVLVR